jgi:hypothetical protein
MTEATRRSFLQASLLATVGGAAPSILERTGVEQDWCLGSTPLDSLRASYANIQKLTGRA